jgi:DeoR family transcriptional regulator of aga operon
MDDPASGAKVMNRRVEIFPAKRRALILDRLRLDGAASIQELSETIGGSISTVRRDIEQLVAEGYLERTHGGALLIRSPGATFEREQQLNAQLRHREKLAIGAEAARRLRDGDSAIFESSSTVFEAVKAAAACDLSLTVVTNSLDIGQFAAGVPKWRVVMPGGTIRPGTSTLTGEPGETFFKTIHADIFLTGAWAVTGLYITDATLELASLKRAMVNSARRTILLVDSSKFSAPGFCTFCEIPAIDEVITDNGIQPGDRAELERLGAKVTVVDIGI